MSFLVAVYWHRIIPPQFRDEAKELEYLRTEQSFIWVALPFTFSFIAVERFFDSRRYQALGFLAMALLTFVVGMCWDRIIPRRSRYKADHSFSEKKQRDSRLSWRFAGMANAISKGVVRPRALGGV